MVKIIYRDQNQEAELVGRSVAEVRNLYKYEFGIPGRAKAILNGKQLEKELEPEVKLSDEDQLCFEAQSRKGLVLLGAFLLALAVTGTMFVFTYTTRSQTITVTAATADFASITTNSTPTAVNLLGSVRGAIGAATMFDITGDSNYNGDVEVIVSLINVDEMVEDYSFWSLRLEYVDSSNTSADLEAITKVITLDSPSTSFAVDSTNISGGTWYVRTPGGSYRALPYSLGSSGNDPVIFCEVIQAGTH